MDSVFRANSMLGVPREATITRADVVANEDRLSVESLPSVQGRLSGTIDAPKDLISSHNGLQVATRSKGKELYQERGPEEQFYGTSGPGTRQNGSQNLDPSPSLPRAVFDTSGTRDLTDQSFGDTILIGGQLNKITENSGQISSKGESMINKSRLQDVLPVQTIVETGFPTLQTPGISQIKPWKDNLESNQSTKTAVEALRQGAPLSPSTLIIQEDTDKDTRSIESKKEEIASQQSTSEILQEYTAGKHLGELLAHNKELQPVYLEALSRMDRTRLAYNLRRLLKYYYLDLCQSADTNIHRAVSRLFDRRWRRVGIAQRIVDVIGTADEDFNLQIEQRTHENFSELSRLETRISQTNHLASSDPLARGDDDEEASSDEEESSTGDEASSNGDNGGELAYGTDHNDSAMLPNIAAAEDFLLAGIPFRKLCVRLQLCLLPPNLASLTRIIMTIPGDRIWFSDEEDASILNQFKAFVEARTEENWDWWPLPPRMLKLRPSQTRMHWRCVSSSKVVN